MTSVSDLLYFSITGELVYRCCDSSKASSMCMTGKIKPFEMDWLNENHKLVTEPIKPISGNLKNPKCQLERAQESVNQPTNHQVSCVRNNQ